MPELPEKGNRGAGGDDRGAGLNASRAQDAGGAGTASAGDILRQRLTGSIARRRAQLFNHAGQRALFDVQLDRHEAKYIVPPRLIQPIRDFIRPFCQPDTHGQGDPPEYVVTTLQLDGPDLPLHRAKVSDALTRFKLRVRTYGEIGKSPVFLEVKRKMGMTVVKSRTVIPFEAWSRDLVYNPRITLSFRSRKEEDGFIDFVRLVRQIGAGPVCLIRYVRESYFSANDRYARVSMDRKLEYQPTRSWDSWGRDGRWIPFDSSLAQNDGYPFSGVILELKTLRDTPQWMIDLVVQFNLARCGNCKYSAAVWQESLFGGRGALPSYATDLLSF